MNRRNTAMASLEKATGEAICTARCGMAAHRRRAAGRRPRPSTTIGALVEQLEARAVFSVAPLAPPRPAPTVPSPPAVESLDGTGNNLAHPQWGSAGQQLVRTTTAAYGDGVSSPAGADRPSARLVSNLLAQSPADGVTNDRDWTAFVYAWGQFLDHDLSLTATASPRESFPVAVPAGDPSFDPAGTGTKTISLSRSAWDPATGTGAANPRQQVNSLSSFIDGSQIYGVDATRAAALREFAGGRLKTSAGGLLPFNTAGLPNANDAHRVADDQLFLAGDVRANENPELLALQTLFVREHNRIATDAATSHPEWTDEQLFQFARRMVIAELQKITYDEFLPALLGWAPAGIGANGIAPYAGYRADVNPGIATEFSTAAFRVGHSMLGDDIQFLANDGTPVASALRLKDAFFDPRPVSSRGIDGVLKYLASDRGQEIDTKVVEDVRNFLFGAPGQGGFDLAALNIQRGRDHGLPDYNTVRAAYGLPRVTSFADITPDVAVQQGLRQAYGSVDKIDLWVGGLAERHLPGSSLGATFTRIIVDQFTRLRDGDRYWYQNVLPADAVRAIQHTTLADVVRRNSQVTNLQPDVFFFRAGIAGTLFADGNRDGVRQPGEPGVAGVQVALVDAAGATVATTRSTPRGDYAFRRLDIGSYKVVVTQPGGGTAGTSVAITRGGELRDANVALTPKAGGQRSDPPAPNPTGAAPRPAPRPASTTRSAPSRDAAFAGLAAAAAQVGPAVAGRGLPGLFGTVTQGVRQR